MERSVPVYDLLGKATGRSTAELRKMSAQSRLGRTAIQLLMKEMGRQAQGAAVEQMQSFNGQVANLGDSWMRIKLMIMDAGPFDFLKRQLAQLAAWLEKLQTSGELAANMQRIGGGSALAPNHCTLTTVTSASARMPRTAALAWRSSSCIGAAILFRNPDS